MPSVHFYALQRLTIWPIRDCGRFPIKIHERLKRAKNLRIALKPLLAILCVVRCLFFYVLFLGIFIDIRLFNFC